MYTYVFFFFSIKETIIQLLYFTVFQNFFDYILWKMLFYAIYFILSTIIINAKTYFHCKYMHVPYNHIYNSNSILCVPWCNSVAETLSPTYNIEDPQTARCEVEEIYRVGGETRVRSLRHWLHSNGTKFAYILLVLYLLYMYTCSRTAGTSSSFIWLALENFLFNCFCIYVSVCVCFTH
jgi:hypothetical protein